MADPAAETRLAARNRRKAAVRSGAGRFTGKSEAAFSMFPPKVERQAQGLSPDTKDPARSVIGRDLSNSPGFPGGLLRWT